MLVSFALVALLCSAAPTASAAEPSVQSSPEERAYLGKALLHVLYLPYYMALKQDPQGFDDYPYQTEGGYGMGTNSWAFSARGSAQLLASGRNAQTARLAVRNEDHLGGEFALETYSAGALAPARTGDYSLHATANFWQDDTMFFDAGFGLTLFQKPETRWGPSAMATAEWFPQKPWALSARYRFSAISWLGAHELEGAAGAAWRRFGASVGYRAFLTPFGAAYGPDLSLKAWF